MIQVNQNLIKEYFKGSKRQDFFKKAIIINQHLSFHIDGYEYADEFVSQDTNGMIKPSDMGNPFFNLLIGERRPNESAEILAYRKKTYISKTTQPCFKVINSLKKIVKSQDWKIDYNDAKVPSKIKDESLEKYCEKDYPLFHSLENWMYTYGMQYILTDPNALIYVEPFSWDVEKGEKWKPIAKFVKSSDLFDYRVGEYAIFKTDRVEKIVVKGETHSLPIMMVMTKDAIIDIIPTDLKQNYKIEVRWQHDLGYLFCFKAGGLYKEFSQGNPLYLSFINPMLSGLDSVAGEVSDLQAEVVQHIYSTMWYISGNDCSNCRGTGTVIGKGSMKKSGQQVACPKCDGGGRLKKSPYKDIVLNPKAGDGNVPTPPAGYINKPTDIVKLQDERIAKHIHDALGALNMEFLAESPLNQSGTAKEVDKDELNNFVYSVAYHLVYNVLKPIYQMTADMRYFELIKSEDERKEMLPSIGVPEKYDLLSKNVLITEFKTSKESSLDMNIINEMENDIINKIFNNEPETKDRLLLIKSLDPLRGLSIENKTTMLLSSSITKEDLIISNYVTQFVDQAIESDDKFMEKEPKEQRAVMAVMAKEKGLDEADKLKEEIIEPNE